MMVLTYVRSIAVGCDISSMSAQVSNPYYLKQFGNPGSSLQGGITAAMAAGSFGGALINSWLSDKIGRKRCIVRSASNRGISRRRRTELTLPPSQIIFGWLWVLGCIIQSVASNIVTLVAGRVVAGLAVGIASAIVTVCTSPSLP